MNSISIRQEAWLRVQLTVRDRHGSDAALAEEVLRSFITVTANYPTVAADSYFVATNIRDISYRFASYHVDSHLDALQSALE